MSKCILTMIITLVLASGCSKPSEINNPLTTARDLNDVPNQALFDRGLQLAREGDFIGAEQYLQSALRSGHDEGAVVRELVKVCLASSRLQTALKYAEPYLERNPGNPRLRYVVATIYASLNQTDRALWILSDVRGEAPDFAEAHYLAALLHRDRTHDLETASTMFAAYLALDAGGPHAAEARAFLRRHPTQADAVTTEAVQ